MSAKWIGGALGCMGGQLGLSPRGRDARQGAALAGGCWTAAAWEAHHHSGVVIRKVCSQDL